MTDARELRIGNYLLHQRNKEIIELITVLGVDYDGTGLFYNYYSQDGSQYPRSTEHFKPIPITGKFLIELGAVEIPKNQFHVTLYCFKDSEYYDWCVGYIEGAWHLFNGKNDAFCNGVNHSELKYIHKLQNLLFEVANVELTKK
jgi:hypothetical protein